MNKTRIAVVGAGVIGRAHMEVALVSETVSLSAVVDPAPGAHELAARAGVPLYRSLQELLARDRPDGVVLATPNPMHVPQALLCLEAGLPMLLEKPLASTVKEGIALVKAAQGVRTPLLIGHHRAHSPIMKKAREVVLSGQLGSLVAVTGSATFFKPDDYFSDAPWRSRTGAGPILLNMIHEVHSLRMLCGDIVAVQAFSSHATRGFAVEDTAAINLRFANGALGTFMLSDTAACGRSWEQTSQENKAYASEQDEDCYVISGTSGSLSVPTMRLKTYSRGQDRSWGKPFTVSIVGLVRDDPIRLQMEHFGAVVRGECAPLVTVRDGLENLRITEAITLAARTGEVVNTTGELSDPT